MPSLIVRYLVLAGIVANLVLVAFGLSWLGGRVTSTEGYRDLRRALLGPLDGVAVTALRPAAPGSVNPAYADLPRGVWVKVHEQSGDGPEVFRRQRHGGGAFDPVRGRVMLFGSDTHRVDWDNTVRFFDMAALRWSRAYPPDDPATYGVDAAGRPVAGARGDRPWAMHTFDAVEFDPVGDRLIVASHPKHLGPDKSWGFDRALWRRIASHPTWAYRVAENRWRPLVDAGESFFPYGTAFDPAGRRLFGVRADGLWELDVDGGTWRRVATGTPRAWHNSVAFDSERDIVVSFGTNRGSNDVWQYRAGDDSVVRMPTPGIRPPGASSPPLAYHPVARRVVALVEEESGTGPGTTGTWLYSTADDAWRQLGSATLPFAIGMNYAMVYDPNHDLLVLVANIRHEPVAVWVLRMPA